VIGAFAVTAEVALRKQNCEQDADVADCLRHGVVDALMEQIERVGRLCATNRKSFVAEDLP
jgi:translation initiation factor 6 (eIF-6)